MTRRGFRLTHNDQRGFTLIELLVAIGIAALITAGITYAIMQILTINHGDSNHMIAVRQVQQAGDQVSKDVLQAQSVNASGPQGFPLILTWKEWGTNDTHTVVYNITGGGELQRTQYLNGGNSTVTTVAKYINPNQTSCTPPGLLPPGHVLTFDVTATVGTKSTTRSYDIQPRPGSE